MQHSEGHRVRLELRNLPSFSLFPGQSVVVEGSNPSGYCLVVDRLVMGLPGARTSDPPAATLSLLVAAGPFSGPQLDYAPLSSLLGFALERRPEVLLLVGPFVDGEQVRDAVGLELTFEQLFDETVCGALESFSREVPGCRILVQPSPRDAHAHAVFPQPPLELPESAAAALTSVANPALLELDGGMTVGVCSADVLRALSGAEASRGCEGDRMARLAAHVLGQRSFFPLFPAPPGLNLDCGLGGGLELACAPHLLILPSDLQPFAKVLKPEDSTSAAAAAEGGDAPMAEAAALTVSAQDTVCINPGRLGRGTCALVHVGVAAEGAAFSSCVRVDLLRTAAA